MTLCGRFGPRRARSRPVCANCASLSLAPSVLVPGDMRQLQTTLPQTVPCPDSPHPHSYLFFRHISELALSLNSLLHIGRSTQKSRPMRRVSRHSRRGKQSREDVMLTPPPLSLSLSDRRFSDGATTNSPFLESTCISARPCASSQMTTIQRQRILDFPNVRLPPRTETRNTSSPQDRHMIHNGDFLR